MDQNSVSRIQISGVKHRITARQQVLPAEYDVNNPPPVRWRFQLACGLTMDAAPGWINTPPETFDGEGNPIEWSIAFSDTDDTDCPACSGA